MVTINAAKIFKKLRYIFQLGIATLLFVSCNSQNEQDKVKIFEYKITYLTSPEENPIISLLPTKMSVYYCDRYIYYHTEGWMGFFSSAQILNLQDSTRVILTKFLDKKFAHIQKLGDKPLSFESTLNFTFVDTAFSVKFKDYNAWQQNITIDSQDKTHNKIVYTNAYKIKNPNVGSPFCAIEGLLLFFPMSTMGISMELELNSVRDTLYSDKMFAIPADYVVVDREEMEKIVAEYSPK